jgi:hypothetical protein
LNNSNPTHNQTNTGSTNTNTNTKTSNISNNNANNINTQREPLIDITNRANQLFVHKYFQTARTQSLPLLSANTNTTTTTTSTVLSPIKITGKRGRSRMYQPLPNCESDYTQCSSANKRNRLELGKAIINQLTHNPNSSNDENENNRVEYLRDLINSDQTHFQPAFERSKLYRKQIVRLTANQAIELKNIGNFTWKQQRLLRSYLSSNNMNFLPSEHKIREKQSEYEYEFEADTIQLNDSTVTYARITDPVLLIQQQIAALHANNQLIDHEGLIPPNSI